MERLRYLFFIGLVSLMLGFTGCKQLQPVVTTDSTSTRTITVTETIRDTILKTLPDSAAIKAWFGCDSLNQIYLKQLAVEQGKTVKQTIQWLPGGLVYVNARVDSQEVYFKWKERYVHEVDSTKVSKVTVVKEKPPWWKFNFKNAALAFIFAFIISLVLSRLKQK